MECIARFFRIWGTKLSDNLDLHLIGLRNALHCQQLETIDNPAEHNPWKFSLVSSRKHAARITESIFDCMAF